MKGGILPCEVHSEGDVTSSNFEAFCGGDASVDAFWEHNLMKLDDIKYCC